MAEVAGTGLTLNPTSGEAWQVQPLVPRVVPVPQCLLHQPVDAPPTLMFAIGEHSEAPLQGCNSVNVVRIDPTGEGILHQVHADPIEVLNDQEIVNPCELSQQCIRGESA